jgi:hypothetical protein
MGGEIRERPEPDLIRLMLVCWRPGGSDRPGHGLFQRRNAQNAADAGVLPGREFS